MKRITSIFFVSCLLLSACSPQHDDDNVSPMLHLQLLLTQAASFAVLPGEDARKHALELARRAMSGPEMNAMHHGGVHIPMMKATHDLGDAVFELLEASSQNVGNESLQQQIQLASQAAQMRLSGQLLSGDAARFMLDKGNSIATPSMSPSEGARTYDKAAIYLFALLNNVARTDKGHKPALPY